jgi:hypothetical protein
VPPTRESFVALKLAQEVARVYELRCTKEVNVLDRLQALLEGGADGVMDPEDEDEDEDLRMVRADAHDAQERGGSSGLKGGADVTESEASTNPEPHRLRSSHAAGELAEYDAACRGEWPCGVRSGSKRHIKCHVSECAAVQRST